MSLNRSFLSFALVITSGAYILSLQHAAEKFETSQVIDAVESKHSDVPLASHSAALPVVQSPSPLMPETHSYPDLKELQADQQIYTIKNDEYSVIEGNMGTVIEFDPHSFRTEEGLLVDGNVQIKLSEYYDLSSIMAAKLTTQTSNDIIETNGMIHIDAYQYGQKLELSDGTRYEVKFPKGRAKEENFELFYGRPTDEGLILWELEKPNVYSSTGFNPQPVLRDTLLSELLVNETSSECFIEISSSYILKADGEIMLHDFYNWQFADTRENLNNHFVSNFNPTPEMLEDFCFLGYECEITFMLDQNGKVTQSYLSKKSLPQWDAVLLNYVRSMPEFDMTLLMPKYENTNRCVLHFKRHRLSEEKHVINDMRRKFFKDTDMIVSNVARNDLFYYVFSSVELGWLNCDRFMNLPGEKNTIYVNTNDPDNTQVSMVFVGENTILQGVQEGSQFIFKNIPENIDIRLIAITCNNGKPTMCAQQANTKQTTHSLSRFKSFTLLELDNQFCRIETENL